MSDQTERDTPPDPWVNIDDREEYIDRLSKALEQHAEEVKKAEGVQYWRGFYQATVNRPGSLSTATDLVEAQKEVARLSAQVEQQKQNALAAVELWKQGTWEDERRIDALRAERDTARQEIARLRMALETLLDEQNDAPLERRRVQWQAAVDAGRAALSTPEHQG